jgi:orotate phosphoribosyltransferase
MKESETLGRQIARKSLELGAIKISTEKPFQWASGYFMPVYNDNRILLSDHDSRRMVVAAMQALLQESGMTVENVCGIPTAGLPWGALLADSLALPFIYVRDKAKEHGMRKQIEGVLHQGQQCVLIEDVVSTGGSAVKVVPVLREEGARVEIALAIFSYNFREGIENFQHQGVKLRSALTYSTLIEVAQETGAITDSDLESLQAWQEDPFAWGAARGFAKIEKN